MDLSLNKMKNKLNMTKTQNFKENNLPSPRSQSNFSQSDRLTQKDLQIVQLQREINELRKENLNLDQIQIQVKEKEIEVRNLEEEKTLLEKSNKLKRENTLQELASLKTKVNSKQKRLQELEQQYQSNLIDFEQLNKIYMEKEQQFIQTNERLQQMNATLKDLSNKTNESDKKKNLLQEEKKILLENIKQLDRTLDQKLLEFKDLKEKVKTQEEELEILEEEKEKCLQESKVIEQNIEELQEEVQRLDGENEEKQIELLKLTGEVQRLGLNNFSLQKLIDTKNKKIKKKDQEIEEIKTKNEKLTEKIDNLENQEKQLQTNQEKLQAETEENEKILKKQQEEKEKLQGQIQAMKKLVERTFQELDEFAKLDDNILKMIKDSENQPFENRDNRAYFERTYSENMASFQSHQIIQIQQQMGNNTSTQKGLLDGLNFQEVQKIVLEGLGEIIIARDVQTGEQFFILATTYSISNKDLAESEIQSLQRVNQLKNSSPLIQYAVEKDKMLCFDNYSLKLVFNDYNQTFEKMSKPNIQVSEQEVWGYIGDLLNYMAELESIGLYNGDLQPKFIQIDEHGNLKVLSPLIFTEYQNAYKYRLANENYKSAFSPELLSQYQHRLQQPSYDAIKSDIFSMGICILCLISNEERFEYFYDFEKNQIWFERIRANLAKSVKSYQFSEQIFFFVDKCLKKDVFERPTLAELFKIHGNSKTMTSTQFWNNNY